MGETGTEVGLRLGNVLSIKAEVRYQRQMLNAAACFYEERSEQER